MNVDIAELREANERAKLERETAELRAETAAITGASLPGQVVDTPEAHGDIVPFTDYPWHDPQFHGGRGGISSHIGAMLGDRRSGRNPPIVWEEENLTEIRAAMRILCEVNPSAQSALLNLTNYVMGTGFTYKMTSIESELQAAAQTVLTEFLTENNWTGENEREGREKELFRRSRRDGEYFLALYHVGNGHVQTRILEPEQITEPDDAENLKLKYAGDEITDWKFGILTDNNDIEHVHGYWAEWETDQGNTKKFFPIDKMVHCKLNVDSNVKRGMSDFYPVYKPLERAGKLLLNVVDGASILSAIAWIVEHPEGVTEGQIQELRSKNAWGRFNQPTLNQGTRNQYVNKIESGTRLDVGKGQKYLPSPLAARGVGDAMVVIENATLRIAGTRWAMPAFMVSGETTAAYAAVLVAESPFVKNCQSLQKDYKGNNAAIIWKAFRIAFDAGRFDRFGVGSFGELRRLLDLSIEAPIVAARDLDKETNRRKVLSDAGILSDPTWSAEEGYDHQKEQSQGAKVRSTDPFGTASQPQPPESTPMRQGKPEHPLKESSATRLQEAAGLLWGDYPGVNGAACPAGLRESSE